MKFRFSLESVLKLREHEKRVEQFRLSKALNKKIELQRAQQKLIQQLEKMNVFLSACSTERMAVWKRYYSFLEQQQKQISIYQTKIEEAEADIKNKRQMLAKADQKARMLEKMKRKEKMHLIDRIEYLERRANNEIATQRYNRR